jgi:uncharacterized damage-inducible protein DinB
VNKFAKEQWPMFEGTHKMRDGMLDTLRDTDLTFSPGGTNMTLGALCKEMGEVEHSYLESIKNLKQDWSYRNQEAGLEGSVSRLKAWMQELDAELTEVVAGMSDDDLRKTIARGFPVAVETQLQIYLQALLIFFGKATVFLKAMDRPLTKELQDWIW